MITIDVAGFALSPFGRWNSDSYSSAERFISDHLQPASEKSKAITLDFDQVRGIGPSWLNEVARFCVAEGLTVTIISNRDRDIPVMFNLSIDEYTPKADRNDDNR